MPSRKSKPTGTRSSRSSAEPSFSSRPSTRVLSESESERWAAEIAEALRREKGPKPRILLSGELGAGKSTFARAMIEALGVDRGAEGSPTFAVAHEYRSDDGTRIVHADGYRLRGDSELEETGLLETLWDPESIVLFEWMERFPETRSALVRGGWSVVSLRFERIEGDPDRRRITVVRES